ncbi:hypothetical protein RSSM_01208 [Rhodopirellula sallentina SM41]|uniref:Uncharacterized protein n=1 Tax=Rhodopirellula sallentina SM41 TaxID=1263870 RepID=M5U7A8_9BACT|nr:hypothetical protein RSSM_01208 [Rhodopirellula sallentina SM41]
MIEQPASRRNDQDPTDTEKGGRDHGVEVVSKPIGGKKRRRVRFGLLELLLLAAVVASWLPVILARRQLPILESEIESMRYATTQLVISDERKLNIRTLPTFWNSVDSWKYFVPAGVDLELRLATEEINSVAFPAQYQAVPLPAGEHAIHLKGTSDADGFHTEVYIDDEIVLQKHHPKSWMDSQGSSSTSGASQRSSSYALEEPLVLKRLTYSESHPLKVYQSIDIPNEYDRKGNYLWISPADLRPPPAGVFHFANDNWREGVGNRQGTRLLHLKQTPDSGMIDVLPAFSSILGDNRDFYPYRPFRISVQPVVSAAQEGFDVPAEGELPGPASYVLRDSLDVNTDIGSRPLEDSVTEASVGNAGKTMSVFAHYDRFDSGARPIVEVLFDADHPNRIGFRPHAGPRSVAMEACQFVTLSDARYLWREVEVAGDAPESEGQKIKRVGLAKFYPEVDFADSGEEDRYEDRFGWRMINDSSLPLASVFGGEATMRRLCLVTDVPNANELTYPPGLGAQWKYEGIPNRQVWLLPEVEADGERAITAEFRATEGFPETFAKIPGGPAIQSVRITIPMPAKQPIWLEILGERMD